MRTLKQSTTVTVKVGPFIDPADRVTEEIALTPGIELSKAGGTFAARNSATAVAHDAEGWYNVELNATDTNTVGRLILKAQDAANHQPVSIEFTVLPANVFDSLIAGTDLLQVDVDQIDGNAAAVANALEFFKGILAGEAVSGTLSITEMTSNLSEVTDDHYNDKYMVWTSGALLGQVTQVTDYVGASKKLTYDAVTEAPSAGDTFVLF